MNLQIRDPRARELARRLAERENVSMTEAVISALEARLREKSGDGRLSERLSRIAADLRAKSRGAGREPTKDEIDGLWGH